MVADGPAPTGTLKKPRCPRSALALVPCRRARKIREELAPAALRCSEEQLQAKPAARSKGLELPAVDLALLDLAS